MGLKLDDLWLTKGSFDLSAKVEIARGERVAVIGPSGAGKSTLFDAIAGFMQPRSGQIVWEDSVINALAPGDRPVAMLFQDNNLFPHLNVGQNIALAFHGRGKLSEQAQRIESTLDRVGLSGFQERKISQLSGGQISRVALARLLLQDRPLWLLDEPFAALGPALKKEMLSLVSEVATEADATVLMITHDPSDARSFGSQTLLVADQTVTGPFETGQLLDNPPEALRGYLG